MDPTEVLATVGTIAQRFAADRATRQLRTTLDVAELDELAAAGILRTGLPASRGGLWHDLRGSTRSICEVYRTLAAGDPSVALASSMHPAVLAFWLASPLVDADAQPDWDAQRQWIFDTVEAGQRWGTITSEPGSGGDVLRSSTVARRDGDGWRLTGQKHFGSGTGTTSYMLTTAVAEGDTVPDWFVVPMDGLDDGSLEGVTVTAPWDGQGMRATQSHALRFDDARAVRVAWPNHLEDLIAASGPFFGTLFTAVVLGVIESAMGAAEAQLGAKASGLRPYEQVEWARARMDAWTVRAAYERMVGDIERDGSAARGSVVRGKTVAAELAESCLSRLCRVIGGGTFSQRSPFSHWFEDVRALGFLRPPWGLAFDGLIADRTPG